VYTQYRYVLYTESEGGTNIRSTQANPLMNLHQISNSPSSNSMVTSESVGSSYTGRQLVHSRIRKLTRIEIDYVRLYL